MASARAISDRARPSSRAMLIVLVGLCIAGSAFSQKQSASPRKSKPAITKSPEIGQSAVVVDETLAVLRKAPSLFAESVHRMSRGRKVQILGVTEADGVKFFKVTAPPANYGWVQADAVFGKFKPADEERLIRLAQAADGFEKVEISRQFFDLYPNSRFKPALLLVYGDVIEDLAVRLSRDASSRLSRTEMAAGGAPMHSYYLNFNMLDRYRKLGVVFLFNPATKQFHYDGESWKEIVAKFTAAPEPAEAQKRLTSLQQKLAKSVSK